MHKTYIQQLAFDGTTYTKGDFKDLYEDFGIVAQDFPLVKYPEPKEPYTQDWKDEDGLDVYIPQTIPLKHYDFKATFLYKGTEANIRNDISSFIDFLYGRNNGAIGSRLAVYDEYTGIGRKDVIVSKVDNRLLFISENDPDAIAQFEVQFTVYDPVTNVSPTTRIVGGVTSVYQLSF